MFEKYSYKKKFTILLLVFFMLLITAYKRSFHTLFQVINEYKTLSDKTNDINKKSNSTEKLIKEINYLDRVTGKEGVTKEIVQQGIISFASTEDPEISINDLQSSHVFSDENYRIISNQLDVTGNCNQLMSLGYNFEKKFDFSRIVSMNFYTTKKNNTSEVLHLKMIFQNYENNK
ncbi:hypothetical protein [Flavobacterium sp. Root420]|uniref:hypothetical protein n=1 Tax=Flavobacterium sp. Root420 TaxID=1736533 RepID=UPI0006FCF567|nr:hypothetical protein [Flavobacterium sp. Root420]KQX15064.1 hypothetical protein ASC72_17890 [Flavobacterium sp. Root420]